jgi:hypothetical protein
MITPSFDANQVGKLHDYLKRQIEHTLCACYKDHTMWMIFVTFLEVQHLNGDIRNGVLRNEFI